MGLCPLLRGLCFSPRCDILLHPLSTQVLPHPFRDESSWGCLGRKLVASVGLPHLGSVLYVSAGTVGWESVCPWAWPSCGSTASLPRSRTSAELSRIFSLVPVGMSQSECWSFLAPLSLLGSQTPNTTETTRTSRCWFHPVTLGC